MAILPILCILMRLPDGDSLLHSSVTCWFDGSSFKGFPIFFLLPDWLKLNHLKSRMECGFPDIFSRHFCSTVAETIGLTNYAARFGAKNVQKTTFEAAEMILGPWNQQNWVYTHQIKIGEKFKYFFKRIAQRTVHLIISLYLLFGNNLQLSLVIDNDLQLSINIVGAASAAAASHSKKVNVAASISSTLKNKGLDMLSFPGE